MFCHECEYAVDFHPGDATVNCNHPFYKPAGGCPPKMDCFCAKRRKDPAPEYEADSDDIPGQTGLFDGIK